MTKKHEELEYCGWCDEVLEGGDVGRGVCQHCIDEENRMAAEEEMELLAERQVADPFIPPDPKYICPENNSVIICVRKEHQARSAIQAIIICYHLKLNPLVIEYGDCVWFKFKNRDQEDKFRTEWIDEIEKEEIIKDEELLEAVCNELLS